MERQELHEAADEFDLEPFEEMHRARGGRSPAAAKRRIGNDDDGYFDNISLSALPSRNYFLIIVIIAAMVLVIGLVVYFRARKSEIAAQLEVNNH